MTTQLQLVNIIIIILYLYSPYRPYGLYRASVPVQGCTFTLVLFREIFPVYSACHTRYTPDCTLCASTVRGMAKTEHNNKTVCYLSRRSACVFIPTKIIRFLMTTAHYIF